jgi:hypothetical protein
MLKNNPSIPSKEQRKNQINILNFMDQERRGSKEFVFPESSLHRRRGSTHVEHSATQSEDEDSSSFEV